MLIFSPNMLKTFLDCPQKYIFKYNEKISVPQKSSWFEKGKKVHALAHYYLRGDDITKLEPVLNNEERIIWQRLKSNPYFQKKYLNSEYNLLCRVGDYWIGGRLDALMTDNNVDNKNEMNLYILDYKTGTIPNKPEQDFQTMVYLLCVAKLYPDAKNIKFVYIDLKNNENHVVEFSEELKVLYEKAIITACNKINSLIPPDEIEHNKRCEFCEYKKICY